MAADLDCGVQQDLQCSNIDKDDWNDFDGFQEESSSAVSSATTDYVELTSSPPKNCANANVGISDFLTGNGEHSLNELLERCFCRTNQLDIQNNLATSKQSTTCNNKSHRDILCGSSIWNTIIDNVGNVLPVDWLATHARQLQLESLNITAVKECLQPTAELDLSDDEELQQSFDMHSLIISSVHQETPVFTAEQVIREIEDMLEEPPSPTVRTSDQDAMFSTELAKIHERSQARISVTKERISGVQGMSASTISELYDELDALVRELSEELVRELARRDELEYEKELKNQFIGLILSIQRRHRELMDNKRRGITANKTVDGANSSSNGNPPGCYLTTLIPYNEKMVPPTVEHLQIYVKILAAINEDSPTVPALLTDYILKVICPTV